MASTILDPTAEAIKDTLAGLSVTPTLTAHKWAPRQLDALPAAVVEPPQFRRTEPDQSESQLGTYDWFIDFPVSIFYELTEAAYAQARIIETVEAFVEAIDADPDLSTADPSLAGQILEAKVTRGEPIVDESRARPYIVYVCTVSIQELVP